MSFFLDAETTSTMNVGNENMVNETAFNFFDSTCQEEEDGNQDAFHAMFNNAADDDPLPSTMFPSSSLTGEKSRGNKSDEVTRKTSKVGKPVLTKNSLQTKNSMLLTTQAPMLDQRSSILQPQLKKSTGTDIQTTAPSSDNEDGHNPTDAKRARQSVHPSSKPMTALAVQPGGTSASSKYTHPMQLRNEQSPVNSSFQLPLIRERTQDRQVENGDKFVGATQTPVVSYCEAPAVNTHTFAVPSLRQESVTSRGHSNDSSTVSITNSDALSAALTSAEYQPLKEQLANIPAAKQTGNFAQQVAISVDALFKCVNTSKQQELAEDQDHQTKYQNKIKTIQIALTSRLKEINDSHQAVVDSKLAKLSAVLDEVKSNQDELAKYRLLLRSLSADLNAEQ